MIARFSVDAGSIKKNKDGSLRFSIFCYNKDDELVLVMKGWRLIAMQSVLPPINQSKYGQAFPLYDMPNLKFQKQLVRDVLTKYESLTSTPTRESPLDKEIRETLARYDAERKDKRE